jgi:hypothetical protein
MDPVPDPLLLRKFGSAGNRTRDLWVSSQELWALDHRSGRYDYTTAWVHKVLHVRLHMFSAPLYYCLSAQSAARETPHVQCTAILLPECTKCSRWDSTCSVHRYTTAWVHKVLHVRLHMFSAPLYYCLNAQSAARETPHVQCTAILLPECTKCSTWDSTCSVHRYTTAWVHKVLHVRLHMFSAPLSVLLQPSADWMEGLSLHAQSNIIEYFWLNGLWDTLCVFVN